MSIYNYFAWAYQRHHQFCICHTNVPLRHKTCWGRKANGHWSSFSSFQEMREMYYSPCSRVRYVGIYSKWPQDRKISTGWLVLVSTRQMWLQDYESVMKNKPFGARKKGLELWTAVSDLLALISRAYHSPIFSHHGL